MSGVNVSSLYVGSSTTANYRGIYRRFTPTPSLQRPQSKFHLIEGPPMLPKIDLVEARFKSLVEEWKKDTRFISSSTQMFSHPAYYQIIGLGLPVLPFLFRELKENGGHWFLALSSITGQNPVKPEDRGRVKRMTEAWLNWGEEHGFI